MGEFFHGWRRTMGIVSLTTACLLMIGWVRSLVKDDIIVVNIGKTWCFNFPSNQCGLGIVAAAYGNDISTIRGGGGLGSISTFPPHPASDC